MYQCGIICGMLVAAHSSDKKRYVDNPQTYKEHITNVFNDSRKFLDDSLKKTKLSKYQIGFLIDVVSLSALYHDIGKLDSSAQAILCGDNDNDNQDTKMLNHVDAGVAILTQRYESTKNLAYLVAAFLIHAHHLGLKNQNPMAQECIDKTNPRRTNYYYKINNRLMRDNRDIFDTYKIECTEKSVMDYINNHIEEYERIHNQEVGIDYQPITNISRKIPITSLQIRIAFSCLVDADHTDTDRFYSQKYKPFEFTKLNTDERLNQLNKYIDGFKNKQIIDVSQERLKSRQLLHTTCLTKEIPNDISFFPLDGSVGLGKTLSGLTYMLRLAQQRKSDRLYNIIPFTNIISQTVQEYRKSVLLPSEDENNINEIHSKCEFEEIWMRKYSNKWNAPINVSTAVQFFESLVSNRPGRCRKLHWFANSIFFFDEFDKSMNHEYWQYILPLLKDLAENFNCSFIFSSGTSAYYWDIFDESEIIVNDIIDKNTYEIFQNLEKKRVKIEVLKEPFSNINKFVSHIQVGMLDKRSGLIVCNTINNASLLAEMLRDCGKFDDYKIYELTGYQTPAHKEKILDNIKIDLLNKIKKVLVVATSTIECGVDISFEIGWREKCGPLNLFQFMGRINRGSISDNAITYVYSWNENLVGKDKPFTENPQLIPGIIVFNSITNFDNLTPSYCTELVRMELNIIANGKGKKLLIMEENRQFEEIKKEFNVIDNATATVIIDKDLIRRIELGEKVQYNEIVRNSIQLWFTKIEKIEDMINLNIIKDLNEREYYVWNEEYDTESGIGKIMLTLR